MKADIAQAWVAALRSGDYEQGTGFLHYTDQGNHRYCCLGVLCDLAVKAGVIPPPVEVGSPLGPNSAHTYEYGTDNPNHEALPPEVRDWAGLLWDDGQYNESVYNVTTSLSSDNDSGATFGEIADIIDQYRDAL